MKRTSEIEEIKSALKRAAYQAVLGTREERSGRFLVTGTRSGRPPDDRSNRAATSRRKGAAVRGR